MKDNENKNNKVPKLFLIFKTINSEEKIFDFRKNVVLTTTDGIKDESYYYIRTTKNMINRYKEQKIIDNNNFLLFRARKSNKGYYELISPIEDCSLVDSDNYNIDIINQLDKKMWYILPTEDKENKYENENKQYNLLENDIIKMGQRKYEIIKKNINISNKLEPEEKYPIFSYPQIKIDGKNKNKICDLCKKPENKEDKLVLKFCNCEKYMHYSCLKNSLKIEESENDKKNVISYECKNFNCETCKIPYSYKYEIKNENNDKKIISFIDIIDIKVPEESVNYIILESLTFIHNKKNEKNIFVVKLNDEEITIGKDNKCDIVDLNKTISREQAILKFNKDNGNLNLINKGRYGTLVLIKNNVKLKVNEKIYIQMENTNIKAEVKEDNEKFKK